MKAFFFDTYALHEMVMGNVAYGTRTDGARMVTTRFNLMELHYILLAKLGKETSERIYDELLPATVDVEDAAIKQANIFRYELRKRDISYVDCIGYILAQRLGIPFLTGDKQFKDLPNVEFIQ